MENFLEILLRLSRDSLIIEERVYVKAICQEAHVKTSSGDMVILGIRIGFAKLTRYEEKTFLGR